MNKPFSGNNSRRDFVKGTSLLAGGILAAPLLSRANFFSGSDDTLKIAVVGCGGRGTGAAMQALSSKQNVKIVAMADAFKDNLDNCHKSLTEEINNSIGELAKDWLNFEIIWKKRKCLKVLLLCRLKSDQTQN